MPIYARCRVLCRNFPTDCEGATIMAEAGLSCAYFTPHSEPMEKVDEKNEWWDDD